MTFPSQQAKILIGISPVAESIDDVLALASRVMRWRRAKRTINNSDEIKLNVTTKFDYALEASIRGVTPPSGRGPQVAPPGTGSSLTYGTQILERPSGNRVTSEKIEPQLFLTTHSIDGHG